MRGHLGVCVALVLAACGGELRVGAGSSGGEGGSSGAASSGGTSTSSGATSSGGTSSGATSSGGTSSGATSSGATSSGGTSSGAASSGGTSSGGASSGGVIPAGQTALFVSPSGNDAGAGTEAAPFQTLARARDAVRTLNGDMKDDIHVYLRGGTYRLTGPVTFGPQDSGTNGHRVVYQAYPGETPVLSGATQVTGWTLHQGSIHKAPLNRTTKLRNLYVNDARAALTRKTATSRGGTGTYAVTAGQAPWAWASGTNADGATYSASDVPAIAANKDDLEIVNGTTWNENIVCVRDVVTNADGSRALLFQQPYGAIAQLPGWGAGFSVSGFHTIYNAYELLNGPGQFFFDKTAGTLYYWPRAGEDLSSADVEAPVAETLLEIAGTSTTKRVANLTFQGLTLAHTDWSLQRVADSHGKGSAQGATMWIAYGTGNWHDTKYQIVDTPPAVVTVTSADSIRFERNVVKHSGSEGISFVNDVVGSSIVGNYVTDIAGSGITIGHPQHIYIGDGGAHEKYAAGVEGVCAKVTISNNVLYDVSTLPGFGGHSGITAFFVDALTVTHNHVQKTAYNGMNLGWGWRNFKDSTTCKNNTVSNNRFIDTLNRLHDSGAIYTIGQMPGTTINENYVRGIPPATSGPTYGLHNDEGSAYITENDSVLDLDPGVKYTINSEDFGEKHDLTILRTYATVNKMGVTPPASRIDPPVVVPDAVWPLTQYGFCLRSGVEDAYADVLPRALVKVQDAVLPASVAVPAGTASLGIRSSGDPAAAVWLAPAGTSSFVEGPTMTRAKGDATTIAVPSAPGTYRLSVVDAQGKKLGESAALVRVR